MLDYNTRQQWCDESEAEAIRKKNVQLQNDAKKAKLRARRKIEDIKLAKACGLDYDEVKDL